MLFCVVSVATGEIFAETLTGEGSARRWIESRGLTFDSLETEEEMAMRFLRRGPMRLSRLRLASRVVNQFMHYAVARLRAGRKATEGGAVRSGRWPTSISTP
jgi:hypothetical protein